MNLRRSRQSLLAIRVLLLPLLGGGEELEEIDAYFLFLLNFLAVV